MIIITHMTESNTNLLLIDGRVSDYQNIINAIRPGVRYIVFNTTDIALIDNSNQTSFQYIKSKIAELGGATTFTSVGLLQHNMKTPDYQMFGSTGSGSGSGEVAATIVSIAENDPTLQTWSGVSGFITALKTNYGIQNFDMMACALYSDPNWKYIIDTLTVQTGVTIRASTDNTGAGALGGNWFLESHTGVNLKDVYFTEAIENYRGMLSESDIFNKFLIDLDGKAWGAGENSYGSLGIGVAHDFYGFNSFISPVKVINITGTVVKISQGYNSTIFLTNDGNVWSCGGSSSYTGTTGIRTVGQSTPLKISSNGGGAASTATDIIDINATGGSGPNGFALLLLKQNGTLLGSGIKDTYQSSGGLLASINTDTAPSYQYVPDLVVIPGYTNISAICGIAGSAFGLLSRDGVLSAPGSNYQLNISNVRTFDAVYDLVLILKTNGTVYTCGYNVNGELGLGHSNITNTPELIPNTVGFTNTDIIAVAVGDYYGLFLKSNGSVYSCGKGGGGRLGLGNETSVTTPTLITALNGINIVAISAKGKCSYFMNANGKVYTCGTGNNGQLFQGNITSTSTLITTSLTPTMISGTWKNLGNSIPTLSNFPDIVASSSSFTLTPPSSTSKGAFTYTSSNLAVATVNSGGIVTVVSLGTTNITATQDASGIYDTRSITASIQISPITPTINSFIVPTKNYGETSFDLVDPSSNSTGAFTFTSSNTSIATISGRTVTILSGGTTTITATQAASVNYISTSITASFIVVPPILSNFSVPSKIYGDSLFNLTDPTSNRVGAFTFTSGNTQVATISGRTVTILSLGISVITASQGGADISASLTVGLNQVITNGPFVIPKPLSNVSTTYADYWNQLGGNITGEAYQDAAGTSVSISADGTVVAIGASENDATASKAGHVRIYKYNANKTVDVTNQTDASFGPVRWDRLGADIDGEWLDDYSGFTVSLSANGRIVAIGAYGNEAAATSGNDDRGHVRVYRYNANKTVAITNQADASFGPVGWDRLGEDIDGLSRSDMLGRVSISADGTIVACGGSGNNNSSGTVRIFKYNASKTTAVTDDTLTTFGPAGWDQLGGNINGEAASTSSGCSLSISADGTVVAIGANYNSGNGLNSGHVRVYKYNVNKTIDVSNQSLTTFGPKGWDRLGDDIDGEAADGQSGYSVSISADGTTVAIGAPYARAPDGYQYGHVRVYKYNANKASAVTDQSSLTTFGPKGWDRLGADIDGENQNDYSGSSVSLSADGTIVAIGANGSDTLEGNSGHVRVYKYNPTKTVEETGQQYVTFGPKGWDRIGRADIDGYGSSGWSVSISNDGTIVAIGAPHADDGGSTGNTPDNRGSTRIYKIDSYGNYTYTSGNSAIADICGNIVLPKTGGSTTITITQSASGANASKSVTVPLTFKGLPTFQTYTIASKNFGATSFDLVDPSSNSIGAFTFTSSNASVATISGRTVTITGVGTTTITALQAESVDYIAGSTTASFTVNPITTVLGALTVPAKTYGDASFNLADPSSNSPATITYTSSNTQVATISERTVTIVGPGTSVITASQAAGNYTAASTTASLNVGFGNLSSLSSKVITDGTFLIPTPTSNVLTTYGTTWNKLGSDILGKVNGDESGTSLSVSADGTIVAIGARSNTSNRGTVCVYKYNDISWNQLGSDINGDASSDYSGQSVSISANGRVVAIGANMNDGSGNLLPDSGHVRIYEFNGSSWIQRGGDIDGEANGDQSGISVSLSEDGNIVAIGAIMNDGSGNALSNSGHVRVYKYNSSKSDPQLTNQNLSTFGPAGWDRLGADIDGEAVNDQSGFSVSISGNGTIVAVGAIFNDGTSGTIDTVDNRGHVRVYKYNSTKTDPQLTNQGLSTYGPVGWDRMGSDIDGEVAADQTGFSVSLSADGSTVAIGSPFYDASGVSNSGRVRVFAWNGTSWGPRGGNINGVALNENLGDSVSLSADGSILSVSSFMKVINYNYSSSTNTWSQIGANVTGNSTLNISISKIALTYSPIVYLDATNSSSYNGSAWTNLGSLGGNVNISNNIELSMIYSLITPYLSELKNTGFYEYLLDGDAYKIGDGGNDMYDNGNYTMLRVDNLQSPDLTYSQTTPTNITVNGKVAQVVSLGYIRPLTMLGFCSQRATIGFNKRGNNGHDSAGTSTPNIVYNGTLINGYTVYAWIRVLLPTKPTICDLYFTIGDSTTTFFSTTMNTYAPSDTNDGVSYMTMDCQNALFGTILLSKPTGQSISVSDCQSVIFNLTNRLISSTGSLFPKRFDEIDNGGSFNFDGSTASESLTIASTTLSELTYVAVVKTNLTSGWATIIDFPNDNLLFGTQNNILSIFSPTINTTFTLTAGVWYLISVTINLSGNVVFYVNGVSVFSTTTTALTGKTSTVFGIGTGAPGPNKGWNGKISSLAVYNRALTSLEIANLNNSYETYRVSLSSQGNIVAIGAREYDGVTGAFTNIGATRVYKIDSYGNYTYTSGNSAIADICGNIVLPKTGGSTTITVIQSASGANASKSATVPLTLKGSPTFQTYTIASKNFGATSFDLVDPSSNSTGAFTFTSSNASVATISGRTVTITGVGTTTITATQAASGDYLTESTSAALVVNLGNPTFQVYTVANKSFGQVPFTINDPSSNNLVGAFTYTSTVPGVATISPEGLITVAGGGTTVIRATQAATASYNAKFVDASFTVLPIDPTIGSLIAPAKNFGDASFNLTDPSSNNLVGAFTYSSSVPGVATITSSGTVTVIGVGTTTITATQAATANYNEKFVTANLVVSASLSNFTVSAKNYGAIAFDLTDPSSTDNTVGFTFSSNNSTVATISGRTVTIHNAGSAVITATQAATSNRGQLDISATLVVNPIAPIITLPSITKIYSDVSFSLSPTSTNLTGILSYSSSNPSIASIVDNSYVLIHNVGSVTIRISQTATNNYTAINDVSSSLLTINKGTSSLASSTFSVASDKIYGDVSFSIISAPNTNNQGSPLTYSSNNTNVATIDNSGIIQLVGFGNVTFTASQVESTLYNVASITSNQLSVSRKTVLLTRSSPSNETITKNYGNAPFTVSASNESNGVLSYESGNTSIATINSSSGEITIVSIGTVTISAYRSQTLQYTSTPISWNLQISRGTTTLSGLSSSTRNVTIAPFTVSAASSATNGTGTVTYALQDPLSTVLTIHPTSGLVTLKAPGSAVIVASQTQGTLYEAPPNISATITVQSAGNALQSSSLTSSNNFNNVSLTGASMSSSTINGTTFVSSILTNTNFNNTTITNSNFTNAELTSASFNSSNINGSTFTGSSMSRSDLSGTVVRSSNFDNADLSGSTLTRMDASGSSLINANLTRANLTNANLTNANLTNANISGANINNVSFSTLQKLQLLKNKENRSISEIQVNETAGNVILSAVSATSEVRNLPNIANTTFKVIVPATAVTPTQALSITNIVLDVTNYTYFYLPINENEYFRIQDVIYYIQGTTVRNYTTGNIVDITSYQTKAVLFITGSLTIVVNSQNTLFASPFVVPTNKITTDAPFNIITPPTSNSTAPIVYSSSNTNIATIHSSTGVITLVGSPGFVTFTASQVATQTHEASSVNSNVLCVNRLIDFTLPGLDQSFNLSTLALLDASGAVLEATDATAVFYVKLSDMTNIFQYQTDSFDINDISATDIKYYVFHRKWPTELKINPAHAMLNKTESSGILGGTTIFSANKMLAKHDFLRHISLRLFNTIHGVDLFNNESDLLENTTYWGENVRTTIDTIISGISTTSSDASLALDSSGNKYLTNTNAGNTNLSREIMRQISATEPSRFNNIQDNVGLKSIPFIENDTLLFKVIFSSALNQSDLTNVTAIPSRSYMVKLIMKNDISGINANTVVIDSEMFPNAYPYSSSVTTYLPTSDSAATVYNVYSPPAPIPFSRFGFNGWYYANSNAWVNVNSGVRNHVKWILPGNNGSSTVGQLQFIRVNMKVYNKTSLPYIIIYTHSGSWRKYSVPVPSALVNETKYSFYVNFNSYARVPAIIGFTNILLTNPSGGIGGGGSFAGSEQIMNIALETTVNETIDSVEFTLANIIVGDSIYGIASEKEYGFEALVPTSYP